MILRCNRYRVTRATKQKFSPDNLQQPGTYIQEAHSSRSIKNSSRSSNKKEPNVEKILSLLTMIKSVAKQAQYVQQLKLIVVISVYKSSVLKLIMTNGLSDHPTVQ